MPDVGASVSQSYFTFHLFTAVADNEVKVGKDCLRGFSYFFRVRTNCVNHKTYVCYTALRMGAVHEEYQTDINHGSNVYQWSRRQVVDDRNLL